MKLLQKHTALPFPECRGKMWTYPCYVEAKIDGELGIYEASSNILFGKNTKARTEFQVTYILQNLVCDLECSYIYGELHYGYGKAGDLYKLLSHYDSDNLNFTVFDYDSDEPYEVRREKLASYLEVNAIHVNNRHSHTLSLVPASYCTDKEDYESTFKNIVDNGYEGVVIKSPTGKLLLGHCPWVKVKKKETADLLVTSADSTKERIGVGMPTCESGVFEELCGVKIAGSSPQERQFMLGKIVEVEYAQVLYKNGKATGLRHPVFKRLRPDKNKVSIKLGGGNESEQSK